jgi:FkbM family methyltransferase
MRQRIINDNFTVVVPDTIADWDAPSNCERERIGHMLENLRFDDVLYDIGTEHGWISILLAVYGVGGENMVLVEPSPEFWPDIRLCWEHNNQGLPIACFPGFVAEDPTLNEGLTLDEIPLRAWPPSADGPESAPMAYRYLHDNHHKIQKIPVATIDQLVEWTGRPPRGITMDIEGAELGALRGAEHTLIHHRPLVWVSIHPTMMRRDYGTYPGDVTRFMMDHGYRPEHLATDHEEHWFFQP